jgi:hypothetical protein
LAAHAALHCGRVEQPHAARARVAGGAAQRHFGVAARGDPNLMVGRYVHRCRRALVEDAVARAERVEALMVGLHVNAAGEHDDAQLARAGIELLRLAVRQAQRTEADMRPAGALRRHVDDVASSGFGLGQQWARHVSATSAFVRSARGPRTARRLRSCWGTRNREVAAPPSGLDHDSRSTMRRSVS